MFSLIKFSFSQHRKAQKYLRALSASSLIYTPAQLRFLSLEQNLADRVVQTFFDTSSYSISVSQAQNRLSCVTNFSTPSHSFYQLCLPFHTNHQLRNRMEQFKSKHIRTGRVLQLMDYIAANVSYRYCMSKEIKDINVLPFISVTACVDEIDFFNEIHSDKQCVFNGYVSYAGNSSMEVHIDVLQQSQMSMHNINHSKMQLACSAKFVMVTKNKETREPYKIPKLNFSQESQLYKIVNQLGSQRQKKRKAEAQKNLQITPPTYQQSVQIHKVHMNKNPTFVSISSTINASTMLMHVQDRNLSGKIFGGFILRLAYQLGWLSAYKFLQSIPKVVFIDDVQFYAPVEIGTFVQFICKVCYVTQQFLHVKIKCKNHKFNGESTTTNVVRVTFQHTKGADVKIVFPETMQDSYHYIESMRLIKKYSG